MFWHLPVGQGRDQPWAAPPWVPASSQHGATRSRRHPPGHHLQATIHLQAGDHLVNRSNCSATFPMPTRTPGTHATSREGKAAQLVEQGPCAREGGGLVLSKCPVLETIPCADMRT